jgi:hypothetical protein
VCNDLPESPSTPFLKSEELALRRVYEVVDMLHNHLETQAVPDVAFVRTHAIELADHATEILTLRKHG